MSTTRKFAIALHGGAGVISKSLGKAVQKSYEDGLAEALHLGTSMLQNGASSMDTVEAVVANLEDNPLFNAGKGAVFNTEGSHELEASIMDGDGNCGACSGLTTIKNPIKLASCIMKNTQHIWLAGRGAEEFAEHMNVERVPKDYFYTERRHEQLKEALRNHCVVLDHSGKMSTVGCVAIDNYGELAVATSTGGMTNKMVGRIGDTPIIGAGTYADKNTCAVSATGIGEKFMKICVAHLVSCLMEYKGMSLDEACKIVVEEKLSKGDGGVIAVGKDYSISMPYNSDGMFRACSDHNGRYEVKIWE